MFESVICMFQGRVWLTRVLRSQDRDSEDPPEELLRGPGGRWSPAHSPAFSGEPSSEEYRVEPSPSLNIELMTLAGRSALLTQGSKAGFRDTLEGVTLIIPNSGEIAEAGECSAQPVLCGAWDGITPESFPGGRAAWAALSSRSSFQFFPTPLSSLFQGDLSWAHLGQMFGPGTIFQGFAAKLPFHVIHFFKAKHEMVLVRARADWKCQELVHCRCSKW